MRFEVKLSSHGAQTFSDPGDAEVWSQSGDWEGWGGSLRCSLHFETTERNPGCGSCSRKPDKPVKLVATELSQLAMNW